MPTRKFPLWLAFVLFIAFIAAHATIVSAEESLPQLIRRVKPSVVSVVTYDAKGEPLMAGSGFFVSAGKVITNLHVIEGAHHVEVRTFDGKGKTYSVDGIIDIDAEGDLAALSVNAPSERTPALEVAAALPEEGEKVFVIGTPLKLEGSVSDGIVSAVREVPNLGRIIQITAPISRGNSGSPVFNMRGEVIGVVTIKVTNGQNINLAMEAARISGLRPGQRLLSFDELATRTRNDGQAPEALAEWWYRNGLNSLWLGNYESALTHFENAVSKNPNRAEAWIQVGFCKLKQGKNNEAIKAYQQALKLRPHSVEALNKLGDAYYYAGNFNRALDSYKQAVRLQPEMAEAHYNLGMTYMEIGDRLSAVVHSQLLKTLDPQLYQKLLREIER
ncbi:MAG TPA: tetratricopeptide repeat protein [Pyrinomonadaceae bacterium]|jgi:Flp pilus assembly protein TadD